MVCKELPRNQRNLVAKRQWLGEEYKEYLRHQIYHETSVDIYHHQVEKIWHCSSDYITKK